MKKVAATYKIAPFPKMRSTEISWMQASKKKNMVHALTEVDVTKARHLLHQHRASTGEGLSFTAFIIACLAHPIAENRAMQAYRKRKHQLVMFDEVDVAPD